MAGFSMRLIGARVRDVFNDIDGSNIGTFELATRIGDFQLDELRALGRVLLTRAGQDNDATQTNEYLTIVQEAVRRLVDTNPIQSHRADQTPSSSSPLAQG
jgi:hypothetical protein